MLRYTFSLSGLTVTQKENMTTSSYESLSHSRWDCKYHVVFIPKCRKKAIYGEVRDFLRRIFHELAKQKGCEIVSGHLVQDHVHMLIRIPPNMLLQKWLAILKGKVRLLWHDNLVNVRETSMVKVFGQEDAPYQR